MELKYLILKARWQELLLVNYGPRPIYNSSMKLKRILGGRIAGKWRWFPRVLMMEDVYYPGDHYTWHIEVANWNNKRKLKPISWA